MKKKRTDQELCDALKHLDDDTLDEDFPERFVDDQLRELGLDPVALGQEGADFVKSLVGPR